MLCRVVTLPAEFATLGALGSHRSSWKISTEPPDPWSRAEMTETAGTCAVWARSERGCSAEREQFCSLSVPAVTQTPARFPMARAATLWASSDGCMSKEAFTLPPSLPAQVSGPCTKVDEDYKGEWCLLALPWERALQDGSIVPGSPWLLAIQVPRELKMMSGFGEKVLKKKKKGRWGLKASRWSTTSRCKSHNTGLLIKASTPEWWKTCPFSNYCCKRCLWWMQVTTQSCNILFYTMHLSMFVSCMIRAFFSPQCDILSLIKCPHFLFLAVLSMDHSRNQNEFATALSSALLCDKSGGSEILHYKVQWREREKKNAVISAFTW